MVIVTNCQQNETIRYLLVTLITLPVFYSVNCIKSNINNFIIDMKEFSGG
jgi:hypothetical protein